jgi:hypothetical protein
MAKLFYICGAHCCGKSTILKRLEQNGDITLRGSEIGNDLFRERLFLTEEANEDFEFEVAHLELQRDFEIVNSKGIVGVETWHPGNIAYAAIRNPTIVSSLLEIARKSPFIDQAYGVWITIDKGVIKKRTKLFQERTDWAPDFYSRINSQIEVCLRLLKLMDRVEIIDGNESIETVINDVEKYFHSVLCTTE